jgi:DNA-directed RNA polymerase sigma subunit (sigma70/sigma32)
MEKTIEKLQKLHSSVQKLESVLQEVWSLIDEVGNDEEFIDLMNKAKKLQSRKQNADKNMEDFVARIDGFDDCMGHIPEDGTAAIDFEDAISELIEWMKNNR